jgi:hypothetical protein
MSFENWTLVDLDDTVDTQEDETGVTQVRNHIIIVIHKQLKLSAVPARRDLKKSRSAISYQLGNIWRMENPSGSGKFICVRDGLKPIGSPLEYIIRTQTWEYYGPWETAPTEWNQ